MSMFLIIITDIWLNFFRHVLCCERNDCTCPIESVIPFTRKEILQQDGHFLQMISLSWLKVESTTFSLVWFLSLTESTCETRKNIFYCTSKALFVFEKIKF